MIDTYKYIIGFLLGENISPEIVDSVGYTADPDEFDKYKLIIQPSSFFENGVYDTEKSIPTLPLKIWEENPILFG